MRPGRSAPLPYTIPTTCISTGGLHQNYRTYPRPAGHSFMTSTAQTRTLDGQPQPEKKPTQKDQDAEDDKPRKHVMKNLVNSWQERLQLISVITTFFATTEAAMLVNTRLASSHDSEFGNNILKVANAGLLGALIFHVYASVLSFLGAFLLISYKLKEARREKLIAEGTLIANSRFAGFVKSDVEWAPIDRLEQTLTSNDTQSMMYKSTNHNMATIPELRPAEQPVFSADSHVEQVVPYLPHESSRRLLCRTHMLCVFLSAIGFVLAIISILCYVWAFQPASVSIFASVCLGAALLATVFLRL